MFLPSYFNKALWLNFEIRKSIHAIEWKTLTFTPNSYQIKIESTIIEELSHKALINLNVVNVELTKLSIILSTKLI
jgi:hypothetical protein